MNGLIESYLQSERTIILAIVPANQDVATVDILERAKKVTFLSFLFVSVLRLLMHTAVGITWSQTGAERGSSFTVQLIVTKRRDCRRTELSFFVDGFSTPRISGTIFWN